MMKTNDQLNNMLNFFSIYLFKEIRKLVKFALTAFKPTICGMSQLTKVTKGLKDYAGTATNVIIVLGTTGIEQITTVVVYRCPCVEPSQLGPGCNETNFSFQCSRTLNYSYGFAFIFAPAVAFYIFSVAASPKMWKVLTGCGGKAAKHKLGTLSATWTIFSILIGAFVSPVTWVCIALIDGRFLACAITPLPYLLGTSRQPSCEDVSKLKSFLAHCQVGSILANRSITKIMTIWLPLSIETLHLL